MKHIICDEQILNIRRQADEIVRRTMTPISWTDVNLVSAEASVSDISELQQLVDFIRQQCNRIVVLAWQSEFTHLIIAKSNNVPFLCTHEIAQPITEEYDGILVGDQWFSQVTLYKDNIIPELIDRAVELIIVALPYEE